MLQVSSELDYFIIPSSIMNNTQKKDQSPTYEMKKINSFLMDLSVMFPWVPYWFYPEVSIIIQTINKHKQTKT